MVKVVLIMQSYLLLVSSASSVEKYRAEVDEIITSTIVDNIHIVASEAPFLFILNPIFETDIK